MYAQRSSRAVLAVALVVAWTGLVCLQAVQAVHSAERRVGFMPDEGAEGIRVTSVQAGQPAARAGLRDRDQVIAVAGERMLKLADYDRVASRFRSRRAVPFRILRHGAMLELSVVPGVPPDWFSFAVNGLAALGFLGIGLLALLQGGAELRTRLLLLFTVAVALELALPANAIGAPWLGAAALSAYYLLTGLQIGLELHLASLIPERHAWLRRRPWMVGVFYGVGLGLGIASCLTYIADEILGWRFLPWTSGDADRLLLNVGVPFWAIAVVLLLAYQTLRYPQPRGRHQAGLVLTGVLPWCLFVVVTTLLGRFGQPVPHWLTALQPLTLLCYPVAFFAAIFRYHLFDIELVVRRSLIYTTLTGTLFLVFYAALGAGGVLFSTLVEGQASVWAVSAATLLLGLLFAPLRRALHRVIDRRFFPERYALRQQLIALASELPALGKLPLMGQHLVERLCHIFAARQAMLLIADPDSGLLSHLASTLPAGEEAAQAPPLLPLDDPGVELLRRAGKPVPARQLLARSATLAHCLAGIEPTLAVPLLGQERLIGVLVVGRKEAARGYPAEEIELLNLLAHHVATVFENARLFESATYESLTGLLRREAILEQLGKELERARRYRRPLTIAMADLDHFKEVNDRYGHLAGDALLQRVAQAAASGLRSTDWMGRYGGEEFLLVLPETDLEGAATVAEKVRSLVQRTAVPMEDGGVARVTISVGLAELDEMWPGDGRPTPRDLIAAADRSLYEAKNGGRNRVHPLVAVA